MRGTYLATDIARYIINYSNDKNYGVSNLKLQKLLYFVQAFFLVNNKEHCPCFSNQIEAWDFGPVVPDVYHEYKQYGSTDIPRISSIFIFDKDNPWDGKIINFDDSFIAGSHKKLINEVVDHFADYSATDLVARTHCQAPWKNAYIPHQNNIITNESILEYFNDVHGL